MAHPIDVVYAKATVILKTDEGADIPVGMGTHWPANDPLVTGHPDAFTPDPRFGLQFSGEPPEYMHLPPDAPIPAELLAAGGSDADDEDDDPTDLGITIAPRAGRGRRD